MEYPVTEIRFKYYGKHLELLIDEAVKVTDAVAQKSLIIHIARLMKSFHLEWNRDSIDDNTLLKHILLLSGDKLTLDKEEIQEFDLLDNSRRERLIGQRKHAGPTHSRQQHNNKRYRRKKF